MISTQNLEALPDRKTLQNICKAISVMDAIISQKWECRYYSYNSKWNKNEECLQMRDGLGDELYVLFRAEGCVINGFAHEYHQADKKKLTYNLPTVFHDFIFGEPVESIGSTFCLWTTELKNWQVGQIENHENDSEELLNIFDGNPQTYIDWATENFEESIKGGGIPFDTANKIYQNQLLTKEMVLSIVDKVEDWKQLENDLNEIDYPYNLK
jgi:hypothetical protein